MKRVAELLRVDPASRERRHKAAMYRALREQGGAGHVPRPTAKWGGGYGGSIPPVADEMTRAQAEADKQERGLMTNYPRRRSSPMTGGWLKGRGLRVGPTSENGDEVPKT